jgi:hypothetical protein
MDEPKKLTEMSVDELKAEINKCWQDIQFTPNVPTPTKNETYAVSGEIAQMDYWHHKARLESTLSRFRMLCEYLLSLKGQEAIGYQAANHRLSFNERL